MDPRRMKREREKAKRLKKSDWWQRKLREGICHYCEKHFKPNQLTMDHLVPLARGGSSTYGNIVPCCKECNQNKKLKTPAEELLEQIKSESNEDSQR